MVNANTRIIVNEGSSRSTKTFSILQYLIMRCINRPIKVTAAREKLTWAKSTVIPDFREVMAEHFGYWDERRWNKTESIYRFANGSEFAFIGLDEAQKLHGRKQHYCWVNEAIELEQREFRQLLLRTTDQVILDYNPSHESHWIYDSVIPRDDCTFIKSTYKDNPFLSQEIVQEIERLEPTPENIRQGTADETSWKIYGLGERAAHKGLIFQNVEICKELPPKLDRKKDIYGLDFGFTNDPSCLVNLVLVHGAIYLDEIFYKRGLTNIINPANTNQPSIQQHLIDFEVPKSANIWADSAEPKSIQDIHNCGWHNCRGVTKGADSVQSGIETLKRYKIFITERSVNGIKEKNNYKWKEDRAGNPTNEPIDMWNHFWDAARYPAFMELKKTLDFSGAISIKGVSKWKK